jgi:type III restriction enzyme
MARLKTKVNETLEDFLFKKIEGDPDYLKWERGYVIPEYITDNLHPERRLRAYQEKGVKHFIWLFENDRANAKHLLFNMATGTGKTLVMAAVVLYLYEKGYRNFLFLVHQIQIREQAVKNFTDYKFDKYLFNPKGIKIKGQKVDVKTVDHVSDSSRDAINFLFFSTSLLYNRLKEDRENGLIAEDFAENNIVIIADEAHRLNVDTRSKKKKDQEEILNWETAVMRAIGAREENLLLEFTATIDLANEAVHTKYKDKIVHRYDFLEFNKDGFCKDVKFLYNQEVHTEDQKRLLIVNAVALSEYRRLLAEKDFGISITPIVLIKSIKIGQSEKDREFFDEVIGSLRPSDLLRLKEIGKENRGREHEILADMFDWLRPDAKTVEATLQGDWDGLKAFVASIRTSFGHDNTLIYNSQKKEKAELLPLLDSSRNTIRAIFSVNALNEGWDVLSLFDIVHFDISEAKKVSLQDIQLIGRGARYMPYELPKRYKSDAEQGMTDSGMFSRRNWEFDKYKRKFDNDPLDRGRVLETFVYHFVKTGMFLDNLQKDLLGQGIINGGVEKKVITMKPEFLESDTYKRGFIFVNGTEKRQRTKDDEIDTTFKRVIKAGSYNLRARGLSDFEQNQIAAGQKIDNIRVNEDFFSLPIIRKALMSAENSFFRFNNIKEHIVEIQSVDELIEKYLPLYEINYMYEEGKSISQLNPQEKLQLLVGVILPEVRKSVDLNMPRIIGSPVFKPVSLAYIFQKEKSLYLTSFPSQDAKTGEKVYVSNDERSRPQTKRDDYGYGSDVSESLECDIESADWYAYNENFGTSEEKKFVKYIAGQIDGIRNKYPGAEVYLIRNELDYRIFGLKDGRTFSPDYVLIINDVAKKKLYYQCIIEPKGGHLLDMDSWKEETLMNLESMSEISLDKGGSEVKDMYEELRLIGMKFYNSNPRGEHDFAKDFQSKLGYE